MSIPNHNGNLEERIIEVARQLFIENGFEETSMSDIAIRVGIKRPVLHYYFRTKNKIFQAVLGQIIQPLIPKVHDVLADSGRPLEERVSGLVDAYYQLFSENPSLPLFVMREVKRDAAHLVETAKSMRLDETATNIVSSLQAEMERGTVKRIPFQYIFFTFYALLTFPFTMKNLCSSIFLSEKENFNEMLENWKPYIVGQMCHLLETHGKAAFNNDRYLSAG